MELLPLFTALLAGFLHALEADHMAAVTTFVSRRPRPREALGFGIRWGMGHSLAILAVGGVLILLDLRFPESVSRGLEFGVGTLLLALGLALLWSIVHERAHRATDNHEAAPHRHSTTWVGVAHGLAGTAAALALLPVAMIASPWFAGAYLLLFGVGTVVAMGLYGLVAGVLFDRAGERTPTLGRVLRVGTALSSSAIGILWMVGALGVGA